MSDDDARVNRGVDIELLVLEIEALRDAARRYADAVAQGKGVGDAGLDLETKALNYVRKLDEEQAKANQIDYVAIVDQALREQAEHAKRTGN